MLAWNGGARSRQHASRGGEHASEATALAFFDAQAPQPRRRPPPVAATPAAAPRRGRAKSISRVTVSRRTQPRGASKTPRSDGSRKRRRSAPEGPIDLDKPLSKPIGQTPMASHRRRGRGSSSPSSGSSRTRGRVSSGSHGSSGGAVVLQFKRSSPKPQRQRKRRRRGHRDEGAPRRAQGQGDRPAAARPSREAALLMPPPAARPKQRKSKTVVIVEEDDGAAKGRPLLAVEPAAAARPAPASGAKPVWSILDEISQPRCAAKEAEEDVENVPPPVLLPPLLRQETASSAGPPVSSVSLPSLAPASDVPPSPIKGGPTVQLEALYPPPPRTRRGAGADAAAGRAPAPAAAAVAAPIARGKPSPYSHILLQAIAAASCK